MDIDLLDLSVAMASLYTGNLRKRTLDYKIFWFGGSIITLIRGKRSHLGAAFMSDITENLFLNLKCS